MNCKTAVILAAGMGTRMKSDKPKVLHEICGKPMVSHVISQVKRAGSANIIVVVGCGAEEVKAAVGTDGVKFAFQAEQSGTGHAVMQAADLISAEGSVFVLCGDTPLITDKTLSAFAKCHEEKNNTLTVLTAVLDDPSGYGRIIKDENGSLIKIVEEKDANEAEKSVKEINSGIYCFEAAFLKERIFALNDDNAQHEYYLTDLIGIAVESGHRVGSFVVGDSDEITGINNRVQLAQADKAMCRRIAHRHMLNGVTIIDPDSVYIEDDVIIGNDTEIWPGAVLKGNTTIGKSCIIGKDTIIENSSVGDCTDILKSVIIDSSVGENTHVGPFAYMRPNSHVGSGCKVGDFVEIKNSVFGDGSKAAHLAYIGDADVGEDVNVGCGVVFANYDGVHKNRSAVGDRAFLGSNSNLIAPVSVAEDAYIAAGTTVASDVAKGALCIGRTKETVVPGWVKAKGLLKKKR